MKTGQGWVLLGGVALALASACGSDGGQSTTSTTSEAGAGGEGPSTPPGTASTSAGAGGNPDTGSGGTPAAVAGADQSGGAGEPAVGGAGGEGGATVVASKDIDGSIYGLSDELVILVDGVNVPIDADGHFKVQNAADEYQLVVCAPNHAFMQMWDGLHTRTPLVDLGTGFGDPPYGATIRGKVTGGLSTPIVVANDEAAFTELAYSSKSHGYLYPLSSIAPPAGYDLKPLWAGSNTDSGEVLAIQYVFKSKVGVQEYTGFGRRPMTIADGNIYGSVNGSAGTDIQLTTPSATSLTGHFSLPAGWTRQGSYVHMGPFSTDLLFEGDFSLVVPQLENLPMWVFIQADGPDGRAEFKAPLPSRSPWNIQVPSPAKALLPVASANAVTQSTVFTWNGVPAGAIVGVSWEVGDWRMQRFTTAGSTTMPDLSPFGVTLPAATEGSWVVEAVGPATTTDDVLNLIHTESLDVAEPGFFIDSADRSFTTAP